MTIRKLLLAVSVVFLSCAPLCAQTKAPTASQSSSASDKLQGLDALASKAMAEWKVPGLAIAVVKDGKVIYAKGFGYRDVEKKLPVTPDTLFAIGSMTKSFTSLTFAMLNDEGKVEWDKPVRTYLPEFTLYDEVSTERATARDLFSHRTGLPRHDLTWYFSTFPRNDLVRRVRYLKPSKDFRTTYQYNNLMMMTMGVVEERVTGKSWEDNVRQRILGPLDMPHSNFSVRDMEKTDDHSLGYDVIDDVAAVVPYHFIDPIGPAGSINSSVNEISHYAIFHLGDGTWQGQRLVSEANLRLVHSPQTVIPDPPPDVRFTEIGHTSYGLAWFVSAYRGHSLIHHAGGIDGFNALLSLLPDDHIGVVVLTNLSSQRASDILTDNVFDRLLDLNQIDWLERFKTLRAKTRAQAEEAKKKKIEAKKPGTHPSHDLADFTGSFEHPGHGILKITRDGDKLWLTINGSFGPYPLDHYHYDFFQISPSVHQPIAGLLIQFHGDNQGAIATVSGPFEPDLGEEIVFQRIPEKHN